MSAPFRSQPEPSVEFDADSMEQLVDHLQQFDGEPAEFLRRLLELQCRMASATAAALLRAGSDGQLEVLAVYPPSVADGTDPVWLAQSAQSSPEVLESSRTMIVPIHGDNAMYDSRPRQHLALLPLKGGSGVRGVASYLLDTGDQTDVAWARERLELSISLLALYEMRLTLEQRNQNLRWLREALEVMAAVNEHDRFRSAGMALCNELASHWDAQRVSIGILRGRYVVLRCLSHSEHFMRKMQAVQDLEAVMEECIDQDVEVLHPSPPDATYVSRAATRLASQQGPSAVCSLPLRRAGRPFGVLTIESDVDRPLSLTDIESVRLIADLCSPRLWELYEHGRWVGSKAAKGTRRGLSNLVGVRHTWAKVLALAAVAAILFLIFVDGDNNVRADFEIQPIERRFIQAPFDGRLESVLVKEADSVVANQTVLATLDTTEIKLDRLETVTQQAAYLKNYEVQLNASKPDEAELSRLQATQLQATIDKYDYYISAARIVAPIDGVVLRGELDKLLQTPFAKGDELFELGQTERLRAVLFVPEDRITELKQQQEGRLITAAQPDDELTFRVEHISPVAEVVETQNVYRVRVDLTDSRDWLQSGMRGTAKVQVGRARWGYILTRDLVNWLKMRLWF